MKFISHRGNLSGKNPNRENSKGSIEQVIKMGYEVEVDLWKIGNSFYLSHELPYYSSTVSEEWLILKSKNLLIHAKNAEAIDWLINGWNKSHGPNFNNFHFFSHEQDKYAWTNYGYLIVYPGQQVIESERTIIMLPELGTSIPKNYYAVCTDYVENYKD